MMKNKGGREEIGGQIGNIFSWHVNISQHIEYSISKIIYINIMVFTENCHIQKHPRTLTK